MATTTPNYGWAVPTSTDLVKDGATAIETLGDAIDASMNTALGTKKAGMVLLNTTSFSAVASQSLNNVFSATYDNYQILLDLTGSTTDGASIKLRASGTDTSTNYSRQYQYADNTSALDGRVTGQSSWGAIDYTSTTRSLVSYDIFNPFLTRATGMVGINMSKYPTAQTLAINAYGQDSSTSFDGFSIIAGSGTITGSVSVYGYNK